MDLRRPLAENWKLEEDLSVIQHLLEPLENELKLLYAEKEKILNKMFDNTEQLRRDRNKTGY